MNDDVYNKDFVLWAPGQAELLRLRAEGKLGNDAEVEWSNIAEEIATLGRSDRRALRNRIRTIRRNSAQAGWHETIIQQQPQM